MDSAAFTNAGDVEAKLLQHRSAPALFTVVSARTAVNPSEPASRSAAAMAAPPTPCPRLLRVSHTPVSSRPGRSVR